MVEMERVTFVVDYEGNILSTEYEKNNAEFKEYGLGTNALSFAKDMTKKGYSVLLVEQGENPFISAIALGEDTAKGNIVEKNEYKSKHGFYVVWESKCELIPNLGKETRFDWVITVILKS